MSPPTSPIRGPSTPPPMEKKARVEDTNINKAVAPELQSVAANAGVIGEQMSKLSAPMRPRKSYGELLDAVAQTPDRLMVPIYRLLEPMQAQVQKIVVEALFKWWENHQYFTNLKIDHNSFSSSINEKKGVDWVDVYLKPRAPFVRSCIWLEAACARLTRDQVEAGRSADSVFAPQYFLACGVRKGEDPFAEEQNAYWEFTQDTICNVSLLMLARAPKVVWEPRDTLLERIVKGGKFKGTGNYADIAQVPINDPKLCEVRDEWLGNGTMSLIKDWKKDPQAIRGVSYSAKCDKYLGKDNKVAYGNRLNLKVAVFGAPNTPVGSVTAYTIDNAADLAALKDSCPFGVEHSWSMRFCEKDKEGKARFKLDLVPHTIVYFPQAAGLKKAMENHSHTAPVNDECAAAAKQLSLMYNAAPTQPALTHMTETEEFASYKVDHA